MMLCKKLYRAIILSLSSFLIIQPASAWQSHFLLTSPILKNMPEVSEQPTIPAETLTAFLEAESENLIPVLKNIDSQPGKMSFLPPLPAELNFNGKDDPAGRSLLQQFTDRARIHPQGNSEMHYDTLFVEYAPLEIHRINNPLQIDEVVLASIAREVPIANPPFEKVNPGELVSPLEIMTSAVDEPDFGMDVNLWEDSKTQFGTRYKLGNTPGFANKDLAIGTQAPFHMGFYYERKITYNTAPFLKRAYPEYRIHFFLTLSQYAFKTKHFYWGYRFLGWAIHYLQDMSQPYHSTLAPGYSTSELLAAYGVTPQSIKNILTNQHLALENYQYNLLRTCLTKDTQNTLILALTNRNNGNIKESYNDDYLRQVVAKESNDRATPLAEALLQVVEYQVLSPTSNLHLGQDANSLHFGDIDTDLYSQIDQNNADVKDLNQELATLFKAINVHTRTMILYVLQSSTEKTKEIPQFN